MTAKFSGKRIIEKNQGRSGTILRMYKNSSGGISAIVRLDGKDERAHTFNISKIEFIK